MERSNKMDTMQNIKRGGKNLSFRNSMHSYICKGEALLYGVKQNEILFQHAMMSKGRNRKKRGKK